MAYPDEIKQIWETVKESFRSECSTTTFDLWYGSITPTSFDPDKFEILFKIDGGQFKKTTLERTYKQKIEERFASVAGLEVTVSFYSDANEENLRDVSQLTVPLVKRILNSDARPASHR